MTSLLHVSNRILGPTDQDPDSNGMESSGPSGGNLVLNPGRI